jgi:hypothetical protein
LCCTIQSGAAAREQGDVRLAGTELPRNGAGDAGARAGDDNDLRFGHAIGFGWSLRFLHALGVPTACAVDPSACHGVVLR